ncbi:MAG: alpha/beta hydrolase [Bdellovibrionota bacterium]
MNKAIIIHGTGGNPKGNWFPWMAAELEKQGVSVQIPRMPTPEGQSLTNWLTAFQQQIGEVDESCTVIGHSVGAVFLLRLLERLSGPIGRSVFVAGFVGRLGAPEFDTLNATFVEAPYDWQTIRKNAGSVLCLSGSDDPYVPREQGRQLATNLNVQEQVIENGGHLNAGSGYLTFPLLLQEVLRSE